MKFYFYYLNKSMICLSMSVKSWWRLNRKLPFENIYKSIAKLNRWLYFQESVKNIKNVRLGRLSEYSNVLKNQSLIKTKNTYWIKVKHETSDSRRNVLRYRNFIGGAQTGRHSIFLQLFEFNLIGQNKLKLGTY